MPNLPGRYAWSNQKDADEPEPDYAIAVEYVKSEAVIVAPDRTEREPCLGGCGEPVGPGMKCVACATRDTLAFFVRRKEEAASRHSATIASRTKKRAPSGRRRRR